MRSEKGAASDSMSETHGSQENLCVISFTSDICSEYISYQLPVNKLQIFFIMLSHMGTYILPQCTLLQPVLLSICIGF